MPGISEVADVVMTLVKADVKSILRRVLPHSVLNPIRVYRSLRTCLGTVFIRLHIARHCDFDPPRSLLARAGSNPFCFLCLGNIYRSAFAESLLRQAMAGCEKKVQVVSAGLWPGSRSALGDVLPNSRRNRRRVWGVDRRPRREAGYAQMVEAASVIFVMDYHNEASFVRRFPSAREKVFLLGSSAGPVPRAGIGSRSLLQRRQPGAGIVPTHQDVSRTSPFS
jgi:protein-tyrosine-phosphatase